MEKRVIFRDRQELQNVDLDNIQEFASSSMQHIVNDAVSDSRHYVGLTVSALSATEARIAPGRFYTSGAAYISEQEQTLNLYQYMPNTSKRILVVVTGGDTVETDIEPRDFLIDLETGTTEPQAVAMQSLRKGVVAIIPGEESVAPQVPAINTDLLAVAYIHLSTTGIDSIEMVEGNQLPQLRKVEERLGEVEAWKGQADPRIATIASDLAALTDRTTDKADRRHIVEIGRDLARLKEAQNLPDTYSSFAADNFVTADETDDAGAGYAARVDNGLLFPFADSAVAPLALSNPTDPAVTQSADELVLPKYSDVARIKTEGHSGDISISQYQTQNHEVKKYTQVHRHYHHGRHWNYHRRWWNWNWSYNWSGWGYWGMRPYWTWHKTTHYKLETTTTSINGAMVAQTLLVSNAMWLTKLGLNFTDVGATGDVAVLLTETVGGKPDMGRTLTSVTVPQADLVKYPLETTIAVPPVLLDAGKRYAVVLITQGAHRAATVSGNDYTQGTLFFGTDGDYFSGDLTKDLMFTLYAARFDNTRTEVELQDVSLAGGLTDIDISTQQVIPDGCELAFEVRVSGKWYRINDTADHLAVAPNLVPLRAVFLGTRDLCPAMQMEANAITVSRPAEDLIHWSTARALPSASEDITVHLVATGYDSADHTITVDLVDGANTYAQTGVVESEEDDEATRLTFTFAPEPGAGISNYQIRTTIARTAGSEPPCITERSDVAV